MPTETPRALLDIRFHEAAQEYLRNLPPEHFIEAESQATQREITVASFHLLRSKRPGFHYFNELLVQYTLKGKEKPGQVVPDNMVVLHDGPLEAGTSYDLTKQPASPYLVLEYVSKNSKRKDYDDNMKRYERELKVPYYLLFYPDTQDLSLYRHNKRKYVSVKPNDNGRLAIPELELEMALLDGWVRYWYQGQLLPLPSDLQQRVDELSRQLDAEREARKAAEARAQVAETRAQAAEARVHAAEARAEEERQARLALEKELQRLRARIE